MSPNRLRRADWGVKPCTLRDARALVEQYHYSRSTANTAVATHGLFRDDGRGGLWGAAVWMPPTPTAARAVAGDDWRGVLTLSRLVVHPDVPINGASFLLGGSMDLLDRGRWPILLTYADSRMGHTGAIYRATNWLDEGDVKAGDTWIGPNGEQRGRKRGPRNYSADEMRAMGFTRAPAGTKRRFTHRTKARS